MGQEALLPRLFIHYFNTMKIKDIVREIENIAPLSYQEDYDNAGLIIGNAEDEVTGILLSLDTTEEVVEEAIRQKMNLIIAHHPIIFKGLKKINGKNYVERTVIKAIQNNIAIYAAHTNLDNVLENGVNMKFARKLGLTGLEILQPKQDMLVKVVVFTPVKDADRIKDAIFESGGGGMGNYSECSFSVTGRGTFRPGENASPAVGEKNKREGIDEVRIEVIVPAAGAGRLIEAVKQVHPYEEMAYDILPLKNEDRETGSGVWGYLPEPMDTGQFLAMLKQSMALPLIKHTGYTGMVHKVAVCGGAGSFLIQAAMREKADAYVTSDLKYHEFFDAENRLLLCDIGHYESEISTLEIFYEVIKEKFPTFAVAFCRTSTNPIQYYQ